MEFLALCIDEPQEEDGADMSVWLELCIYNWHSDKARPYEGCKYRVFDTFFLKE